jgi:glycosyltransferase involved in cell wall biosynthesis
MDESPVSAKARPRVSIIIPAYNEERTISDVLTAVQAVDASALGVERQIIVVDDGSEDATVELVRRHPGVELVRLAENRGKARAIRAAIEHATGDWILIQDADLEYDPSDHPALLGPLLRGEARVVFGSRFLKRAWPRRMRLAHFAANKLLTALANALYGVRITDEATAYKAFDAALIKSLPLRAERFDFCPEVVALLGRRGVRIHEVPIEYIARRWHEGKKIAWRDGVSAIWTLLSNRLR